MSLGKRLTTALALLVLSFAAAAAWPCTPATGEHGTMDWLDSAPPTAPIRPRDCARSLQTPPAFSWPDRGPGFQYTLTLTFPDGRSTSRITRDNWLAWPERLAPGAYAWRVDTGSEFGRARHFEIGPDATAFTVPDWTVLLERAQAKDRPRALPPERAAYAQFLRRSEGLDYLFGAVEDRLDDELPEQAPGLETKAIADLCRFAQEAAFAWVVSGQRHYYAEAFRRLQHLLAWAPDGPTSVRVADVPAREIAWTLTLLYDWLWPELDPDLAARLLHAIEARAGDIHADLTHPRRRVTSRPFDSHGNLSLTYLAAISTIMAGATPAAQTWLRDALPAAVHWTSPWGGDDGGFANGTAYAQWDTGALLIPWSVLRWTVDVNLADKIWVRNYARYLAYFLPPGTPAGAFGDGAERMLTESWARYGKAFARFAPSPLARWYASELTGEDPGRLDLLLMPEPQLAPPAFPRDLASSATFESIGWSAMHSDLRDPDRISVYFKSSPYGSYNHSHADQNSFVINAGGERLAIDSGYYDDYRSAHWSQWYQRTIAHNAITYDGGRGQQLFERSDEIGPGTIAHYEHHPTYDVVRGDATRAYGGELSRAERTVIFLRPDTLVVYDQLASATPRQWEWNVHALSSFASVGAHGIAIDHRGTRLCIDMLESPGVEFLAADTFGRAPQGPERAAQWHGAFVTTARTANATFLSVLQVGCNSDAASLAFDDCGWTLTIGRREVSNCDGRIGADAAIKADAGAERTLSGD